MSGGITIETQGQVRIIRIDDPATLNALTPEMADTIRAAIEEAPASSRAVLLAGHERAFCSGLNLAGLDLARLGEIDAGAQLERHFNPLIAAIRNSAVPIVSVVRGSAAGIGASIALAADIIVASETSYFLQAFARIGLVPDGGATWLLAKAIGRVRAMELMLLAEKLQARTALEWGLITRLLPDDEAEAGAIALASGLAQGPVQALASTRRLVWQGAESGFAAQLQRERDCQREAGNHRDFAEGVTAFLQRRATAFGAA